VCQKNRRQGHVARGCGEGLRVRDVRVRGSRQGLRQGHVGGRASGRRGPFARKPQRRKQRASPFLSYRPSIRLDSAQSKKKSKTTRIRCPLGNSSSQKIRTSVLQMVLLHLISCFQSAPQTSGAKKKLTNFLLARRGHQGGEALFVYRYTLSVVRRDGRGNAQMRHRRRPPFARDSWAQLAVASAPHPSRPALDASAPGAREAPPHSSLTLTGKQSAWAPLSPPV